MRTSGEGRLLELWFGRISLKPEGEGVWRGMPRSALFDCIIICEKGRMKAGLV